MIVSSKTKYPQFIVFESFLLISGPSILAWLGVLGFEHRMLPAGILTGLALFKVLQEKWSATELGIDFYFTKKALVDHVLLTALSVFGLFAIAFLLKDTWALRTITPLIIVISLVVSVAQEFVFRSFLFQRLKSINLSDDIIVLVSSINFASIHLFYNKFTYEFTGMTFIYGVITGYLYLRHKNLFLLILSHWICNLAGFHLKLF